LTVLHVGSFSDSLTPLSSSGVVRVQKE